MLPGFRFLLAAIVLSISIVTFGLGAAALLRAAHEEFASIPARRVTPEPYFAAPAETATPTLALLRFEPPQDNDAPSVEEPAPDAVPVPKVDIERLAALRVEDTPAETAKVETTPAVQPNNEAAAEPPSAPVTAEPPAETKLAAVDATLAPPVVEPTTPPVDLIAPPATTDSNLPAATETPPTQTAALASPAAPVDAKTDSKTTSAKADRAEARKKKRAERAKERRRLAARRARLAAQQAALATMPSATVQQPAGLFGEATPQPQPAPSKRRR